MMSGRSWNIASWMWLAPSLMFVIGDAKPETIYGTLILAVLARAVADILEAIHRRLNNPPDKERA